MSYGFAFTEPAYVAAALQVRKTRAAYFAACQTNPWDETAVRLAADDYAAALALARAAEDAAIADLRERTHGPTTQLVSQKKARFS